MPTVTRRKKQLKSAKDKRSISHRDQTPESSSATNGKNITVVIFSDSAVFIGINTS